MTSTPEMGRLEPGRYKILTLRQPWAWIVTRGPKNIENRTWPTRHRGHFLIHAGSEMTRREYGEACELIHSIDPSVVVPAKSELEFGGVVGEARVVDLIPPRVTPPVDETFVIERWHFPLQYGWVLEDRRPLEFYPCKGMQSLWTLTVPPAAPKECRV